MSGARPSRGSHCGTFRSHGSLTRGELTQARRSARWKYGKNEFQDRDDRDQIGRLIDEATQANAHETARLASRPLVTASDLLLVALVFSAAFAVAALFRV